MAAIAPCGLPGRSVVSDSADLQFLNDLKEKMAQKLLTLNFLLNNSRVEPPRAWNGSCRTHPLLPQAVNLSITPCAFQTSSRISDPRHNETSIRGERGAPRLWVDRTRSSMWQRLCCHAAYTPRRPASTVMSRDVLPSSPFEAKSHLIIEEVPDGDLLVLSFRAPFFPRLPHPHLLPQFPPDVWSTARGVYTPQHVSRLISHTADTECTCSVFFYARGSCKMHACSPQDHPRTRHHTLQYTGLPWTFIANGCLWTLIGLRVGA